MIVEGVPSGLPIDEDYVEEQMARRQKGYGSGGRMKIEKGPRAVIRGGVRHGKAPRIANRHVDREQRLR